MNRADSLNLIVLAGIGVCTIMFIALASYQTNQPHFARHNAIVIEPKFTEAAYQTGSWYDNRNVITVSLNYTDDFRTMYGGSGKGFSALAQSRRADLTNDIEVAMHPEMLSSYNRVILLHNEYVTKAEYDAIMSHHNVFYAYPNALNKFVRLNYNSTSKVGSITLVNFTGNSFSGSVWGEVNEFKSCLTWPFKVVDYPNGSGLSCYPEHSLQNNTKLIDIVLNYTKIE